MLLRATERKPAASLVEYGIPPSPSVKRSRVLLANGEFELYYIALLHRLTYLDNIVFYYVE